MKLEDCRELPDRISIEDCAKCLKKAMSYYYQKEVNKQEFLEVMLELTSLQVMTYDIVEKDLRDEIDRCISSMWNTDSYDDVDAILSIVINLGLEKTYELIKESLYCKENMEENIFEEIRECIEENGEDISNPYRFLEEK